nr:hypothetical protein [Gemmatimonadales bacterium]
MRLLALVALLSVCLLPRSAAAREHWRLRQGASGVADTTAEAALVELRLGQLASRTVLAYGAGSDVLLPLMQFFELAGIHATADSAGGVSGLLQPGSVPVRVSPRRRELQVGRTTVTVAPAELRQAEGELYLSAARLGALLGIRIVVNWSDLEVVVPDPSALPIAQARRREAARALLLRSHGNEAAEATTVPEGSGGWHGMVADYSLLAPARDPLGGGSYSIALGSNVLGGSLELGARSRGRADAGSASVDASWLGVWRANRRITQLRLGDGQATGPRGRQLRGFGVTNAPFLRPSLVGTIPYRGQLPDGWQVEFYRGGELVAFDSAGANNQFSAELPVVYGENPIDIVAYGPSGETRTIGRTFRVSSALLPARRFEYGLSAGGCRYVACRGTGNLDLRYGVSRRWTAQAGVDALTRDSLGNLWHPYASITGSLTNSWNAQVEAVGNGFVRAGLDYEPSIDVHLVGEVARYDDRVFASLMNPGRRRFRTALTAFVRPDRAHDYFYLEGSAEHTVSAGGIADRVRIGMSTQVGPIRLLPYVRFEQEHGPFMVAGTRGYQGFAAIVLPRAGWGPLLRPVWVRTALEGQGVRRLSLAMLTAARPVTASTRVEVGVRWARGTGGPTFTMGVASFLRAFRALTTFDAPAGGVPSVSQLVQGSVMYDRDAGAVTLASGPALQRSGVT